MVHADALSRVVGGDIDNPQSVEAELSEWLEVFIALIKEERVRFMQQAEHSRKLIGLLENKDKLSKQEKSEINGFELFSRILYRLHKAGTPATQDFQIDEEEECH